MLSVLASVALMLIVIVGSLAVAFWAAGEGVRAGVVHEDDPEFLAAVASRAEELRPR